MPSRVVSLVALLFLAPGSSWAWPDTPTDQYGDRLPTGAVARLGSERLRPGRDTDALVFTGDGKLLASAHGDAHVELWEARTGKHAGRLSVTGGKLCSLACSADGKYLAAGDREGNDLWVWDLGTGKPPRRLRGHTSQPRSLAFSPDGRTLASSSHHHNDAPTDRAVRLWDSATGKVLGELSGHEYGTLKVAFLADGKRLVGLGGDSVLRVWDWAGGKEVGQHELPGSAVAAHPLADGKTVGILAWKDRASVVELWDADAGKVIRTDTQADIQELGLVAAPAGDRLAVFGAEGLRVFRATTGKLQRTFASDAPIQTAAFSPDGKTLAAATAERIHLWDAVSGKELSTAAPEGALRFARFLPGGRQIVTAHGDRTIRVWDAATGRQLGRKSVDAETGSLAYDLSPDGKTLAVPHLAGNTVILWDVERGRPRRTYRVGDFTQTHHYRFSPDARTLAVAWYQAAQNPDAMPSAHKVSLLDVASGKVREVLDDEFGPIHSVLFSPDGKHLVVATGEEEHIWTAWDVGTGGKLHDRYHEGRPLFFLRDSRTVAVAPQHEKHGPSGVTLCDLHAGKGRPQLPAGPGHYLLGHSPDRSAVVLGPWPWQEAPLVMRDLATGKLLGRLEGHRGSVAEAVYSDDGARLATMGHDNTVLVWDLAALRKAQAARGKRLNADELEKLWLALGGPETDLGAFDRLAGSPDEAVAFLRDRVTPVSDAGLAGHVADLDSQDFRRREQAERELRRMEFAAVPALKEALAGKPSLGQRRKIENLLGELEEPFAPHLLQRWRAVTVLEQIGSPASRRLLETLAGGATGARLTREARVAVERLTTQQKRARP